MRPLTILIRSLALIWAIGHFSAPSADFQPQQQYTPPSLAFRMDEGCLRFNYSVRDLVFVAGVNTVPGQHPDPFDPSTPAQQVVLSGGFVGWTASRSTFQRYISISMQISPLSIRYVHTFSTKTLVADVTMESIKTIVLRV